MLCVWAECDQHEPDEKDMLSVAASAGDEGRDPGFLCQRVNVNRLVAGGARRCRRL